jgi:RNA polymerase sigma factor (sigma-70 family)
VSSPIAIGARSTTAPPGDARSARLDERLDDGPLIDAVRAGDLNAFGTLYERHVGAARALARRLCTNRADVDDVVGDVFTNTLRAIKSGRGPRDDLHSYVLTAVRNTVIKSQTRRDTARAVPTAHEQLDAPEADDPYRCADPIAHAFVQLPDRFRDVLWSTCVEGHGPQDVAARTAMSTGAVTSLTLRARRALMRSYFVSRIEQPEASPDCAPVRQLLPTLIEGDAAPSTVTRVETHMATCPDCEAALSEMRALAAHIRSSFPWFAAVLAWTRAMLGRAAAPVSNAASAATGGSTLVAAVVVMSIATGDRPPDTTPHAPARKPVTVSVAPTSPNDTGNVLGRVAVPPPAGKPAVSAPRDATPSARRLPSYPPVTVREVGRASAPAEADREAVVEAPPAEPIIDPEPIPIVDPVDPVVAPLVPLVAAGTGIVVDEVVTPAVEVATTALTDVTEVVTTVATQTIQPVLAETIDVIDEGVVAGGDVVGEVINAALEVPPAVEATVAETIDEEPADALVGTVDQLL